MHLGRALVALRVPGSTILTVDAQDAVRLGQPLVVSRYRAPPINLQLPVPG
jgi:hypothetical protein